MATENEYDPYADVIAGNQESIIRVLREALTRIQSALATGRYGLARRIIEAANKYHPMHEESWCGWPEANDPPGPPNPPKGDPREVA